MYSYKSTVCLCSSMIVKRRTRAPQNMKTTFSYPLQHTLPSFLNRIVACKIQTFHNIVPSRIELFFLFYGIQPTWAKYNLKITYQKFSPIKLWIIFEGYWNSISNLSVHILLPYLPLCLSTCLRWYVQ